MYGGRGGMHDSSHNSRDIFVNKIARTKMPVGIIRGYAAWHKKYGIMLGTFGASRRLAEELWMNKQDKELGSERIRIMDVNIVPVEICRMSE